MSPTDFSVCGASLAKDVRNIVLTGGHRSEAINSDVSRVNVANHDLVRTLNCGTFSLTRYLLYCSSIGLTVNASVNWDDNSYT